MKSKYENIIRYEYFIIEEASAFSLLTLMSFQPSNCDSQELVKVNSFSKQTKQWRHKRFHIEKYSNFNGCPLIFMTYPAEPEFIMEETANERNKLSFKCTGYSCAVVKDFAPSLNYTYQVILGSDSKNVLFHAFLTTTRFSMFARHGGDFGEHKSTITRPIYYLEKIIAVSRGEEFNTYEKMLLPFGKLTWIWISITIASAFITIFVLRFTSSEVANFVIGQGNRTPALNIFRIFFGLPQTASPRRNFARYLLMVFILFSMLVRTAYKQKMFEFLQKSMRKPTLTSIAELIHENYTVHNMEKYQKHFVDENDSNRSAVHYI